MRRINQKEFKAAEEGGEVKRTNAKKARPLMTVTTRRCFGIAATARLIGCHPVHLSYIMHGKRKPNDTLRRRLARMGITCAVDGRDF